MLNLCGLRPIRTIEKVKGLLQWKCINFNSCRLASSSTDNSSKWYSVNGFSKFASRKDLELCLGDVQPISVDPILDPNLYPTGRWAILLPNDIVNVVKSQIYERMGKRVYCLGPFRNSQKEQLRTASRYGITNRTVRFRNVHRSIGPDELRFFLRDYGVASGNEAIQKIPTFWSTAQKTPQFSHYLVHFQNSEEAERLVIEKCFANLEGQPIQMLWYNC
jgi:hypothetical protein